MARLPALPSVPAALRGAMAERTRWPALDGLRGLAILGVVAYHAFKMVGGWTARKVRVDGLDWYWWPIGGGRIGVDIFFVLSGFLLWFSWQGIRKRNASLGGATGEFVKGRAVRILPPYYVMLAVFVPLFGRELLQSAEGFWHLFLFLTLQQFNEPDLASIFNTPLWTLTVEVQFYVLMPFIALVVRRTRPVVPLLFTLALTLWWVDNRGVYPTSWLLGRADQFVAGMAVASLVGDHLAGHTRALIRVLRTRTAAWTLAAAATVVSLYHGSTLGLPRGDIYDQWAHPALGLFFAGLVAHLVVTERQGVVHRMLAHDSLRIFGTLSYAMYLWHFPIYEHVLSWTNGTGGGLLSVDAWLGIALATALTLIASALSYAWIERPFLARKVRSATAHAPDAGDSGAPPDAGDSGAPPDAGDSGVRPGSASSGSGGGPAAGGC